MFEIREDRKFERTGSSKTCFHRLNKRPFHYFLHKNEGSKGQTALYEKRKMYWERQQPVTGDRARLVSSCVDLCRRLQTWPFSEIKMMVMKGKAPHSFKY